MIVVGVGEAWDFLMSFVVDRAEVAPTSPGLVTEIQEDVLQE